MALSLLDQMKSEGITPNEITYNAVIHAAAGGGTNSSRDTAKSSPPDGETPSSPSRSAANAAGGPREANTLDDGGAVPRRWERVMPLMDEMQAAG